ncbi:uncharacterized protein EI97DRAFT_503364 [Westerdykella ornata]|uniref:BTB domain-containing protein n=1 Tax=Westerdykella ornata TaxID=318751 RepID=A0A6A6JA78_WESOR|nr:uncharacterized protein EI97DRAFT_503364 [Westerdykella ornata]KAF2273491.1 hypothetical protein EI97DRAFT_503364 [Westerdykella ornata]
MPRHFVTLNVQDFKYRIEKAILQLFPYFEELLAKCDDHSDMQEDGSYFVDADPDVFKHIVAFMRRPTKFPLFWTKEAGFDYALYNKLEVEADHFRLWDLRDWIREKRYLDAVRSFVEIKVLSEQEVEDGFHYQRTGADLTVQGFLGFYSGEPGYRNPCPLHPRKADPTCAPCSDLVRAHGLRYYDAPKMFTLVTRDIVFDETVCVNAWRRPEDGYGPGYESDDESMERGHQEDEENFKYA